MIIQLTPIKIPDIPVEAEVITPSHFVAKSIDEIRQLEVYQGKQRLTLEDFFEVNGEPTDDIAELTIKIEGDLRRIKYIGHQMNGGRIEIHGDVGMYLGSQMQAGRIHVHGSVGAWAAAEMSGGNIQIEGDAGDFLCAGLRGSSEGMKGGRVYVAGNVGREMAAHMRKGFISVKGSIGEMAASRMQGGTIIVCGNASPRLGVQATRGMILIRGKLESVLPTYRFSGVAVREFTSYYMRYLFTRRPDFIDRYGPDEKWIKFQGDFAEGRPNTELYVLSNTNNQLLVNGE
ncbi:MAG: formylmethanofuran dehydrogenase subunit C [Candidatus Thorarchaeota archaeon]